MKIKNITIKNFLSVGAVTQSVKFTDRGLTLILGENLDQGGNGARNGVGKSTILQALSYALYDTPITPIKKDNLINKTNGKNMVVSVEFEVNGINYRVERGRKPNFFKFFIDEIEQEEKDEAQGEMRNTQAEVIRTLGMSYDLFKHVVALSTYTPPFLLQRQADQRTIIEELLRITELSEKAEILKKQIKAFRDSIKEEEIRIKTVKDSNENIKKTITQLKIKSKGFETRKVDNIKEFGDAIDALEHIDIQAEIDMHNNIKDYQTRSTDIKTFRKYVVQYENECAYLTTRISNIESSLTDLYNQTCPTCGQEIHDDKHEKIVEELEAESKALQEKLNTATNNLNKYSDKINEIGELGDAPSTFYETIDEAYQHKQNLDSIKYQLEEEKKKENPYDEQIESLNEHAIQEIDYTHLNELKTFLEHQEFLHKLLTSKDSFIRKKIIDQNLAHLNSRLSYYLSKMGLPHDVEFKNDLSVEIVLLGQDYDFGSLSRGQQHRLVLALYWSFRDVWESTGHPINLLFMDEIIDSGLDTMGVENTLEILKKQARERNKDIFLISHKEELINRVHNVMMVVMENGFTQYSSETE